MQKEISSVLKGLLKEVADAPLECDGRTTCTSYVLNENDIPHVCFCGSFVLANGASISAHFWIEIPDHDLIIDYSARMWLGESDLVPHGILRRADWKDAYRGTETAMPMITDSIYKIMMIPIPTTLSEFGKSK